MDSVLVTGASRGIGAAILEALSTVNDAAEGQGSLQLFAACRRWRDSLPQASAPAPPRHWIAADLSQADGVQRLIQGMAAIDADFQLSALVLNAGVARPESWDSISGGSNRADTGATRQRGGQAPESPLSEHLLLNLEVPLRLLQALLRDQRLRPGASVVFVGSNLARRGIFNKVSYSAAKAGLEGATRSLAKSLAPQRIRVNTVAPGIIATDMTSDFSEELLGEYKQQNPCGRVGTPEDVARVVLFFLSPASAYVNGQVLDVDGGWAC